MASKSSTAVVTTATSNDNTKNPSVTPSPESIELMNSDHTTDEFTDSIPSVQVAVVQEPPMNGGSIMDSSNSNETSNNDEHVTSSSSSGDSDNKNNNKNKSDNNNTMSLPTRSSEEVSFTSSSPTRTTMDHKEESSRQTDALNATATAATASPNPTTTTRMSHTATDERFVLEPQNTFQSQSSMLEGVLEATLDQTNYYSNNNDTDDEDNGHTAADLETVHNNNGQHQHHLSLSQQPTTTFADTMSGSETSHNNDKEEAPLWTPPPPPSDSQQQQQQQQKEGETIVDYHTLSPPTSDATAPPVSNDSGTTSMNGVDNTTATKMKQPPTPPTDTNITLKRPSPEVIDLLDSDDDDEQQHPPPMAAPAAASLPLFKRARTHMHDHNSVSYNHRAAMVQKWSQPNTAPRPRTVYPPPMYPPPAAYAPRPPPPPTLDTPYYEDFPPDFCPTWNEMVPKVKVPKTVAAQPSNERKAFELSLLNVNEFTIEGIAPSYDSLPSSITGLRPAIKKISRKHGKAVYERDKDHNGGGKWRIPLGAYQEFATFLQQSNNTTFVRGIPTNQLQIASLERARQERGYPKPDQVMEYGVPRGLASALAPFQRGGVDFVREKGGRVLIADEMGLGKTIQAVASMAMYHTEWPILVLCPSGARYHWEAEFKNWLGVKSSVNRDEHEGAFPDARPNGPLLQDWQITTLTSSKDTLIPNKDTKVVVMSYGLAPALAESNRLFPGLFKCAIVDESHMLKSKTSKRTRLLVPILSATTRCILLSGTPALNRPMELWPQLQIVGTEQHGWDHTEQSFVDMYVKKGGRRSNAELHTMLVGTVMIRRLKADILKTMPRKIREKAEVNVVHDVALRNEFKDLMQQLRETKGALGKLAQIHHIEEKERQAAQQNPPSQGPVVEFDHRGFEDGKRRIREYVTRTAGHLPPEGQAQMILQYEGQLFTQFQQDGGNGLANNASLQGRLALESSAARLEAEDNKRRMLLSHLYSLTAKVKIPLLVDMLKRWLEDPTKGKVCIFAHHISVLDALRDQCHLTKDGAKGPKHIRIDGSTLPKARQDQITAFQSDPSIRVALLGITAAGVAVTLTASSTVWFSELFWTPAIMVQAEDRCHRIGQSARVHCLYMVAKGTLDEVLWKLLEKKFQDLGEFVEGKEKQKVVVEKLYGSHKCLYDSLFESADDGGSDSDEDGDDDGFGDLELDDDILKDVEELGEEERQMLQKVNQEDTDGNPQAAGDSKMPASELPSQIPLGLTEEDAIALSDDEEEPPSELPAKETAAVATTEADLPVTPPRLSVLADCKMYKIFFRDSKLGVNLTIFERRPIIASVSPERAANLGNDSKPAAGDILVSINRCNLSLGHDLSVITNWIHGALSGGMVELKFVEAPKFKELFANSESPEGKRALRKEVVASRTDLQLINGR